MKQIWNTYKSSVILLGSMVLGGVIGFFWGPGAETVSYTHLDVYKRQVLEIQRVS